jgi:ribose/xylose/arabinose/galactoside ABC-type transport system permease subunit
VKRITSSVIVKEGSKYFLLIACVLVALAFGLAEPKFFALKNILDIIRSSAVLGITATAMVFVMANGELDFAAGSQLSLGAVIVGSLMDKEAFSGIYPVALLIGVAALACVGFVHYLLSVEVGMPSFVATLGTSSVMTGISKYLTNVGLFYSARWPKSYTFLGQSFLFGIVPTPVLVLIVVATFSTLFMERTRRGRYFYAVGSNPTAAAHVGINVKRTKMLGFIMCSAFCGLAGILQTSTINSASATLGADTLMGAMSAMMLGATFLRPGVFNAPGAAVGALMLAIIQNGLIMVGATFYIKDVVQGLILIFAVGIIAVIRKGFTISIL